MHVCDISTMLGIDSLDEDASGGIWEIRISNSSPSRSETRSVGALPMVTSPTVAGG
jgi:hypothetical protein